MKTLTAVGWGGGGGGGRHERSISGRINYYFGKMTVSFVIK